MYDYAFASPRYRKPSALSETSIFFSAAFIWKSNHRSKMGKRFRIRANKSKLINTLEFENSQNLRYQSVVKVSVSSVETIEFHSTNVLSIYARICILIRSPVSIVAASKHINIMIRRWIEIVHHAHATRTHLIAHTHLCRFANDDSHKNTYNATRMC